MKKKVEDLTIGEFMLVRVRKIHNTDPERTEDYKVSIEGAEYIDNPYRPFNLTGYLNKGDSRFVGNTPRRGWTTAGAKNWQADFGALVDIKAIEKLEFSSAQDNVKVEDWKEGVHFITIGLVNPVLNIGKRKYGFTVQILESTTQRNSNQPEKRNPAKKDNAGNMQIQTVGGKPIYTTSQLAFAQLDAKGERILTKQHASRFLLSDQMIEAAKEGRLLIDLEEEMAQVIPGVDQLGQLQKELALADSTKD